MLATACYTLVVALHAVDALTCFGKDELFDLGVTGAACEAGGVVGFVAGHDGFLHDGKVADVAGIVALAADGVTVGEEEDVVSLCADPVLALCASEAFDVP